jgi:hypothetical protein
VVVGVGGGSDYQDKPWISGFADVVDKLWTSSIVEMTDDEGGAGKKTECHEEH